MSKALSKRHRHGWQLWLSRCQPRAKAYWKTRVNTWSCKKLQVFADYVYVKHMGGELPFSLYRLWFVSSRLLWAFFCAR